jgi:hypothetical protein
MPLRAACGPVLPLPRAIWASTCMPSGIPLWHVLISHCRVRWESKLPDKEALLLLLLLLADMPFGIWLSGEPQRTLLLARASYMRTGQSLYQPSYIQTPHPMPVLRPACARRHVLRLPARPSSKALECSHWASWTLGPSCTDISDASPFPCPSSLWRFPIWPGPSTHPHSSFGVSLKRLIDIPALVQLLVFELSPRVFRCVTLLPCRIDALIWVKALEDQLSSKW